MSKSIRTVLITGGAGFIGSHVADELLARGYRVRALDNLTPQVHGEARRRPAYLAADVDLVVGDVRDASAVDHALDGVDAVFHFAAALGVAQSMYDVVHYTSVNNAGTSLLMERLIQRPVKRLVLGSSMSVYGEGLYRDGAGTVRTARTRTLDQLRRGDWELCDDQSRRLHPAPTVETKPVSLESVYALSKFDQERMCLMLGRAYDIPTVALRFFHVFGTRQPLSNPYTGALSTFAARILNGNPPLVFEDGNQQRDFVSVHDVARACRLALESDAATGMVLNIGSGKPLSIVSVARSMADVLGAPHLEPEVTGRYRIGDVRHCFADISLARRVLGYDPKVSFDAGLTDLARWFRGQIALGTDRDAELKAELEARGLSL